MPIRLPRLAGLTATVLLVAPALAQPGTDLGRHFGFEPMRTIVVDDNFGPVISADFNNDGRPDLAVVNNRKSRIELHYLRASERTDAERGKGAKVNELPPSPWYDREFISVPHRVMGLRAFDADKDGKLDLVYAGSNPSELVILRQESASKFPVLTKREVKGLAARQAGLEIADVAGGPEPELIATADERIQVFPLSESGIIGAPMRVGTSGSYAAVFIEDYNGDGLKDLLGVIPDDPAPLRLLLQRQDPRKAVKDGLLAAELRFEMPGLLEVQPVRFPGRAAASVAVIERASKRLVCYDLSSKAIEAADGRGGASGGGGAQRQVRAEVWAFTDGTSKDRSVTVADLDADGRLDLLATDSKANTVAFYRQAPQIGLGSAEQFSAFKKPKSIAVGQWGAGAAAAGSAGANPPEVFILSEEEKTVGVSSFDPATGRLSFPAPISIKTAGASPVAMGYVTLNGQGQLAVIVKDKRDHTIELHRPSSGDAASTEAVALKLENVSRPPQSMLAADADQDGHTDVLLFTPNEPMVMVRATGTGEGKDSDYTVLTDKQMPQFGLVQAAGPDNTMLMDMDGDGKSELLIADDNYIRACRYDSTLGWRVVDQITMPEPGTKLVGIGELKLNGRTVIVASDRGNGRLVLLARESIAAAKDGTATDKTDAAAASSGGWKTIQQLRLMGFPVGAIHAGAFGGDDQPSVLCIADDGFALVRLGGERAELDSFAAYRAESDDRMEHEIEVGDLNGDGAVDLVVLDAGERMCEVFTFTNSRKLLPATEFEVFQTRLFSRGQTRESEPRAAIVADVTGDGADDLVLSVHDRVIIYPQQVKGR